MTALSSTKTSRAFVVWFRDLDRWSVGSFIKTGWHWPAETIRPLSSVLCRRSVEMDRTAASTDATRLVTLHFDGEMELRDAVAGERFKGRLFFADPGDVIYSKIDVRNGAIGIVPEELGRVCVSTEYPVYSVDTQAAEARYIRLLFRTEVFRRKINSMISGASGRKRVQPSDLESVEVPLPPLSVQRKIVAKWEESRAYAATKAAKIEKREREIEARFLADLGLDDPGTQIGGTFGIHEKMYEALARNDVVVVDLSGVRPNVCVEAGYALKSLDRGRLILMFQPTKETANNRAWNDPPFDLTTFRYERIADTGEIPDKLKPHLRAIYQNAVNG